MKALFRTIPLDRIDDSWDSFSPSWPGESEDLLRSIERVDLIQPPLIVERAAGFAVVCGLRRVRAAKKLGISAIECRVIEGTPPAEQALLALNMEDDLSTRSFGLFERARSARLIASLSPGVRSELIDRFGPRLGFAGGHGAWASYLALDALPWRVKAFAHAKSMPARLVLPLCDLDPRDAEELAGLAARYGLTASQTAEFAESIREVMERDGGTFSAILAGLVKGLDKGSSTPKELRETLVERLRRFRFPRWKERERAMKECLGAVNGTPGVSVFWPPGFEGDSLRAAVSFRSPGELASRAEALGRFARSPAAARAFELL